MASSPLPVTHDSSVSYLILDEERARLGTIMICIQPRMHWPPHHHHHQGQLGPLFHMAWCGRTWGESLKRLISICAFNLGFYLLSRNPIVHHLSAFHHFHHHHDPLSSYVILGPFSTTLWDLWQPSIDICLPSCNAYYVVSKGHWYLLVGGIENTYTCDICVFL